MIIIILIKIIHNIIIFHNLGSFSEVSNLSVNPFSNSNLFEVHFWRKKGNLYRSIEFSKSVKMIKATCHCNIHFKLRIVYILLHSRILKEFAHFGLEDVVINNHCHKIYNYI